MKNALKTLLAVAALGAASIANAALIPSNGSVTIYDTPWDGNLVGGEYRGEVGDFDFYTFCLEKGEPLGTLPGTFDYTLGDAVDIDGDVLSRGSAYLYKKFVQGSLYSRTEDAAHDSMAGALQAAIWYLEGEVGANYVFVPGNAFLAIVEGVYGSIAAAKADNDDVQGVRVMTLTRNGEQYQDVIVYVPDSGATLALLGLGLTGLALVRRRSR